MEVDCKLEEGISMASQVLITVSKDEEERARLLRDEKIEMDYRSGLSEAKREGQEEERQKNHNEKLKIVRNALAEGIAPEVIQKVSGLDLNTIMKANA